jgi:hypothetical protein
MLCCASIAFLYRPESVVICMTDDGFVRVVGDFVIGEKLQVIRIIFDQSTILPNFWMSHSKISMSDRAQCLI